MIFVSDNGCVHCQDFSNLCAARFDPPPHLALLSTEQRQIECWRNSLRLDSSAEESW